MNLVPEISDSREEIATIRRDIHAHPELAFHENRTSDLVADRLEAWGVEVHRGIARTGIVGAVRAGRSDRAIGLRADMDALPMGEANTFEHRSRHEGRMHACGHDGHTAMLLGAAQHLARHRNFDGTVYFIFQPAEEHEGGGKAMVEEGLFERFPMESVYGMHNWPGLPVGSFAVMPGPMMACSDQLEILITGHGAHAAMPHNGIDPIVVGSALIQSLQTLVSRNIHPVDAAVLTITQFHAGDAWNVIPDTALLRGTVRAFKPELQDKMEAGIQRICAGVAAAYGATIEARYERGYPPTVNWPKETEVAATVLEQMVGKDNVHRDLMPTMGAEDFAFMLEKKPGCYIWAGNGPGEGGCMLHNPHYDFNDALIPVGSSYWVRLVEHILKA
jgi:amidohydrolase